MALRPLLALLLSLPLSIPAMPADDVPGMDKGDAAAMAKAAIAHDWTATVLPGGRDVELRSPIYPMAFGQGCVIHRLYFLGDLAGPSMAQLVTDDLYHAFATGDACATVPPAHFFGIEPGNDVAGLLDLARRLAAGPQPGRDTLTRAAQARVPACFTPDARATTRITRAVSHREGGGEVFTVALACDHLRDGEEIHARGTRNSDRVRWDIGSLTTVERADGP